MEYGATVLMVRPTLADIAEHALPAGFSIRPWQPGDELTWMRIWVMADPFSVVTPATWEKSFGARRGAVPERQYFLCDAKGREVGTATAWFGYEEVDPEAGAVRKVAIVPEMQGIGLAKPLVSLILWRLKELGYTRAHLTTEEARLGAINLYLDLGFVPKVRNDKDRATWQRVRRQLRGSVLDGVDLHE